MHCSRTAIYQDIFFRVFYCMSKCSYITLWLFFKIIRQNLATYSVHYEHNSKQDNQLIGKFEKAIFHTTEQSLLRDDYFVRSNAFMPTHFIIIATYPISKSQF